MKAADWVLARPWAITEEDLGVILAIAERRNESPEAVEAKLGRPLDNSQSVTVRDGVALIPVVGPIARYADFFAEISGATAIDTLAKDFRSALDDRSIKAIVLNMDTPGGTVAGVSEFASHVREARGVKPIVAYVGARAQSAGYWIASAADRIVADPTAMLGSIGVVMGMRPRSGADKTIEFVSSQSPRKRPDPASESGRAQIQATTDDLADVFVSAVAANRDVSRETVLDDFGRGGSLVGAKAVSAGLADSLGSLEGVISCLARGEMPCPPLPRKAAPKKADISPRRAAMSEPNATENQTPPIISAEELAQLRKDAASATLHRHQAEAEARLRIGTEAKAYAASLIDVAAARATPAERQSIQDAYVQAALDDRAHPIEGRPAARQDHVKALCEKRPPHGLTKEVPLGARALASDPAEDDEETLAARKLEEEFEADVKSYARSMNGAPR